MTIIDTMPSNHQKLAGRGLPQYAMQSSRAASAGLTVSSLMANAAELALRDPSMTKEQHFARLLRANPQVYAEYLAANPAQTGGRR